MSLVLIIDDDLSLLSLYKKALEQSGYQVKAVNNSESGLSWAFELHPDLILLDISLPKKDGLEVLRELRRDDWGSSVTVIMLTNLEADDQIVKRMSVNQPAYYLLKSEISDPGVVVGIVKKALTEVF